MTWMVGVQGGKIKIRCWVGRSKTMNWWDFNNCREQEYLLDINQVYDVK